MRHRWYIAIFWLCSCGSGSEGSTEVVLSNGWEALAAHDPNAAIDFFEDARHRNPSSALPFNGLGWAHALAGDVKSSEENFRKGSTKDMVPTDLWAGWSLTLNAMGEWELANATMDSVWTRDPSWQHEQLPGFDYRDLHVVKAENHFLMGEFSLCLQEIQVLVPQFEVDIASEAGRMLLAERIELLKDFLF